MKKRFIEVRVIFNNNPGDMLESTVTLAADIPLNATAIRGLIQERLTNLLAYNSDKGLENLFNQKGE